MHRATASAGLLALLLLAAAPAGAQMLVCHSHTMTANDYRGMRSEARRVAQGHVLGKVSFVCMNPGRGHVWVDAKPEPQSDGSVLRLALLCTRGTRPWKCELNTSRHLEFTLPLAGIGQKFDVQIPPDMDVEHARALAGAAFEKGASLSVGEACDRQSTGPRSERDDRIERDLHANFSPRGEPFEGSIEMTDGGATVSSGSYELEFHRASPADPWVFFCWWTIVIVT